MSNGLYLLLFAICAQQVVQAFGLYFIDKRHRRFQREVRRYMDWPSLSKFESVGGTGNIHRRKLAWKARFVLWLTGVRERIAKWVSP